MVITKMGKKVCMVTGKELMSNPSSIPVSATPSITSSPKVHFKIAADKHMKLYQRKYLVSVLQIQTLSKHLPCAHVDRGPFRVHHTKSAGYMLVNKDKELVFDLDHPKSPEHHPKKVTSSATNTLFLLSNPRTSLHSTNLLTR
jgi:hypothetical protein